MFDPSHGVCPSCHRTGRVGHACTHRACARDDRRFIPERFAAADSPDDARIGLVIARHLLVERLARPDVDLAYRALQLPALLEVELALAPPERDADVHDNLFRQALALGRLGASPHVTRLVYFGAEPEGTVLATDSTCELATLDEVVSADGNEAIDPAAARLILEPLAAANAALGRAQLVHGAIRPRSVFVHDGVGEKPHIVLGGFVRVPPVHAAPAESPFDDVFRPPEQLFEHRVGPTTDGYAIAAIGFCLLFGRPPVAVHPHERLVMDKRDRDRDVMEGLSEAVPPEVVHFFQAALAYEPSERFDHAGLSRALQRALDAYTGEESEPRRAEPVERVPRRATVDPSVPVLESAPASTGRPPRFHRDAAPADKWTSRAVALPDEELEELTGAADRPEEHAGSTLRLSTRELSDLEARRATPRMHKKP